ncbi:MAG: two-component sensor histidine kinase [Actinobacteria bacterium]|nr:two-component sensor histidine kinase [Actinomycetota bacterium]
MTAGPVNAVQGMPTSRSVLPEEAARLLNALPLASVVVDIQGNVLRSTPRAEALGIVRRDVIVVAEIAKLIDETIRSLTTRERQVRVRRPPLGKDMLDLRVLVVPLSADAFAVLVEDLSDERRVAAVRRDFVANVSHELKTPVGAMALLAEAILSAADDEEAVRRFAERMLTESGRLSSLINDIINLSRLQGDDPLTHAEIFDVDLLVAQAADEVRTVAGAKDIEVITSCDSGVALLGDRSQILMALRNLLINAVTHSESQTRVAVAVRADEHVVEIDVKDQGAGIPAHDLDRVLERFYRVDPARSRITGGTGLGLAIVKHVCENHGGEVGVWSEVGVGSTFTLRLPRAAAAAPLIATPASDKGELVT